MRNGDVYEKRVCIQQYCKMVVEIRIRVHRNQLGEWWIGTVTGNSI